MLQQNEVSGLEKYRDAPILIVDDDQSSCMFIEHAISSLGMKPESVNRMSSARNRIEQNRYDVIILDVYLAECMGLDLIPEIKKFCPETKIIVVTGFADKDIAIRALRLGAFDLLEKPFEAELIDHALYSAFEVLQAERQIKRLIKDLEAARTSELLTNKEHLESLTGRLIETNKALSLFAQNIELEREQMEKQVALRIRSLVLPLLEKLQKDDNLRIYRFDLDLLRKQIGDLTTTFTADARLAAALSHAELRIASLIKNGLSTEQIAEHLHVSSATVRTHRKNIRKKLKINNSQYNLRNFLSSKNGLSDS